MVLAASAAFMILKPGGLGGRGPPGKFFENEHLIREFQGQFLSIEHQIQIDFGIHKLCFFLLTSTLYFIYQE